MSWLALESKLLPERDDPLLRAEVWRLSIYVSALFVAYALHLAVHEVRFGAAAWAACAALVAIALSPGRLGLLRIGIAALLAHAVTFPLLAEATTSGLGLNAAVAAKPVWSQLLIALIANRALASEARVSFARRWRDPMYRGGGVGAQSMLAAISFGIFLTLLYYVATGHFALPTVHGPLRVIVSALLGETIVHAAIILLFFVIVAAILDAARLHVHDQRLLDEFRGAAAQARAAGRRWDVNAILERALGSAGHLRGYRLLSAAAAAAEGPAADRRLDLSSEAFNGASRRFLRSLIPFLPLLGFLGTVIGLATAIADLPTDLRGADRALDVSSSLAGLAVKFETTLLGLLASMIASLGLLALEKSEAELAAECLLIAGAAPAAAPAPASAV